MKSLISLLAILTLAWDSILATDDFKRICYFRIKDSLDVQSINGTLCTHILYAFASVSPQGELVPSSPDDTQYYEQVSNIKFKYPGVKVLLSVGGAGSTTTFHEVSVDWLSRGK